MFIIDAHLDLAMNALQYGRDLRQSVAALRKKEADAPVSVGTCTVSLPELRRAEIGMVFATFWAKPDGDPEREHREAQEQLAYYRDLEAQGEITLITDLDRLNAHVERWADPSPFSANERELARTEIRVPSRPFADRKDLPIGVILSMEGAGPIRSPEEVAAWREAGLRAIGPAWYGPNRYVHGTSSSGPISDLGRELLRAMQEAGLLLDLSHLAEESFYQALDAFSGPLLCSHSNVRALVPGDRQLSDDMIRRVIERGGVVGAVMDAWMLQPGYVKGGDNPPVSLSAYVDHLDHVCQLAGNSAHAALGSDLDGGYGQEQSPHDLDTIADLPQVADLLRARGYGKEDVAAILHGNWLRLLRAAWGG